MSLGNVARVAAVVGACIAAAGSAGSNSQNPPPQGAYGASAQGPNNSGPPPAQQMDPTRALGLWRSTFGAVKIEPDDSKGGLQSGAVQGVWVYQRQGQEVVGYFAGNLNGNVLQFGWEEPSNPPLVGQGYLVFDAQGRQYTGRWWSDRRDRVGDWNGWRAAETRGVGRGPAEPAPSEPGPGGDGDPYDQGPDQSYGPQPGPPPSARPPAPLAPSRTYY